MRRLTVLLAWLMFALPVNTEATTITFDDVVGSQVDITTRYSASLGVTLNAILNPFPLAGTFPASATVPAIQGGATTWTEGFASATSGTQVAVAAATATTGQPGQGGILFTFASNISSFSLVGNDLGFGSGDDEAVTLTAYDAQGALLGQTFNATNLPAGLLDQTTGSISFPNMRFVAFNYTNTDFGFYAVDDVTFQSTASPVPEPGSLALLAGGLTALMARRRRTSSPR